MTFPAKVKNPVPAQGNELRWESEELFFDGDTFFTSLKSAIASAERSIELECYIFSQDSLGTEIIEALCAAAKRGVQVRIMVDGIGSLGWGPRYSEQLNQAGASYRIFHQVPWEWLRMHGPNPGLLVSFIELLTRLNKRNHRKFCIIDERTAFIGSMNIWDVHLESRHGPDAWRDTGARIQGDEVINLLTAFNIVWFTKRQKLLYFLRSRGRRMLFPESSLVRLNSTRKLRRKNYLGLISRIRSAKHRLWITNSYFVPHGALLRALGRASARNVDVRIIVPSRSDVIFMPWVTASFYQGLLKKGVRIFEYQKSVLHAKSIIIDDWTILGSSNLNYR
ncbi:MAG: cardiolipin synthase B, partial [Proteobacteria bacterium]